MTISEIASKDAPVTFNEKGGGQSDIKVRFDLIDSNAIFAMAKVLHEGACKYGENNWRKIDIEDHLNHLIMHAYAYLSGDHSDEHLSHIMCRAMFAQGVAFDNHSAEKTVDVPQTFIQGMFYLNHKTRQIRCGEPYCDWKVLSDIFNPPYPPGYGILQQHVASHGYVGTLTICPEPTVE